jgi:hypothetical protein
MYLVFFISTGSVDDPTTYYGGGAKGYVDYLSLA